MEQKVSLLVRFCWGWIIFVSLITIVHVMYRTWWLSEGVSGNVMPNMLNPGQPNDPQYIANATGSYLHLIFGAIMYILGPIQFMDSLRKKYKHLHKLSGYIFIFATLASGGAAVYMGLKFPVGGTQETMSTLIFSGVMLYSVCRGLYMILERNIVKHKEWMIRTYMIGLGPATMHMIIPIFIQAGGKTIGEALALSLWVGFVLHLILAEVWINNNRAKQVNKARKSAKVEPSRISRQEPTIDLPQKARPRPGKLEMYEIKI